MKKKIITIAAILSVNTIFAGCTKGFLPISTEIEHLEVVQIFGIDKCTTNPEYVSVSVITQKQKESSKEGGTTNQMYTILSESGPTVFDAVRGIKAHSNKMIFMGYIDYFIIGEEAAKENFTKYFDYISRDQEIRLSPKVYIIRECSAKEFMEKTSSTDKSIAERLDSFEDDIKLIGNSDQVSIIEIMQLMDNKSSGFLIPSIKMTEVKNEMMIGGQIPEKNILLDGYAVIKDFRLVGHIEEPWARGYNFLVNKVQSSPINVEQSAGKDVGLEIIHAETKFETHFDDDELTGVTFNTSFRSGFVEQHTREVLFKQNNLKDLSNKQAKQIKGEIKKVIEESQKLKTDCINLGDRIRIKHPLKWEKIKNRWKEIYPELKIEVNVRSKIVRSYTITEPNGFKKGS